MATESFGRYEIRQRLGKGGMATVYLAYDPRFDREVALKVLPEVFLHDESFRQRFEREARIIARLEHKAIVPVYDFGEHNNQPYLVMRHMVGGSLSERLDGRKTLNSHEVLSIVQRIASALDEAHQHGIIHRDLKPGNILFDQYGEAYLADFGIAKLGEATASLTGNTIVGTPAYMSPEQVHGRKKIDGRSDIYTLGIILYELLTGDVPYQADTPVQQMMAHVLEPIPDMPTPDEWDLPEECSDVIRKALSKEPGQRHDTASELAYELTEALGASTENIVIKKRPASPAPATPALPGTKLLSSKDTGDALINPSAAGQNRSTDVHGDRTTSFTPEEMATFGAGGAQTEFVSAETVPSQNTDPATSSTPIAQDRNVMWMLGIVIALLVAIVTIGAFYIIVIEGDFNESDNEGDEEAVAVATAMPEPTATTATAENLSYENTFLARLPDEVQPLFELPTDTTLQFEFFDENLPQIEFLLETEDPNALLRSYQEKAFENDLENIQIDLYTAETGEGFLNASGLSDNRYFDVSLRASENAGSYLYTVAILDESSILFEDDPIFDEDRVIFDEFLSEIDPELQEIFIALIPNDAVLIETDARQPDFPTIQFDTNAPADEVREAVDNLIEQFDLDAPGAPQFDADEGSITILIGGLSRQRAIRHTTWGESESDLRESGIEISIVNGLRDGERLPEPPGDGRGSGNNNGGVPPQESLAFFENQFLPNINPALHPFFIFPADGDIEFTETLNPNAPVLEYELNRFSPEMANNYRTQLTEAGLVEIDATQPTDFSETISFRMPNNRIFVLELEWNNNGPEQTLVSISIELPENE